MWLERGFASAYLLLVCLLLLFPVPVRAVWEWMSPEQYLQDSTLIAILRVGEIHQAWTPENILIESATATVEKVIYYQFAADEKLPDTIVAKGCFISLFRFITTRQTRPSAGDGKGDNQFRSLLHTCIPQDF